MKRFFKHGMVAALTLMFAMLLGGAALHAVDRDDVQLGVSPGQNGQGVDVQWFIMNDSIVAHTVDIYAEKGLFYNVSDITSPDHHVTITSSDWNMQQGIYEYMYNASFDKDYYSFYITITAADGTVLTSNVSPVNLNDYHDMKYLVFHSQPIPMAYVGVEYKYKAIAFDPQDTSAAITYSLGQKPDGMTIDASTGEISWTPTAKGQFEVWIHAVSQNNSNAQGDQYFNITVFGCQTPATVSGQITDNNGNPVTNGLVGFLPIDEIGHGNGNSNYIVQVGQHGNYKVKLDEGDYYMAYQDASGYFQYYENTTNLDSAKVITVACGDSSTYNMTIQGEQQHHVYTVSGTVVDQDTVPVKHCMVVYEGQSDHGKMIQSSATTDNNGVYSLQLPDGYTYIAYIPAQNDPIHGSSKILYYNQTFARDSAEEIALTGDRNDVNFMLQLTDSSTYYNVSGNVSMSDGTPVTKALVVFQGESQDGGITYGGPYRMEQVYTDSLGNYSVKLASQFNYIAYAVVENRMLYRPLYYNQTYDYNQATVISLTADRNDINFVFDTTGVKTFMASGIVTDADGNPVEGATVVFNGYTDDTGNYYNSRQNSVTTDAEGKYQIELPDVYKYISYAFEPNGVGQHGCVQPLFFDQTYNPDDATTIVMTADRNDINFQFAAQPNYNASISGDVEDQSGDIIPNVFLMAYKLNDVNHPYNSWMVISDQSGQFDFQTLSAGNYVLFAVPQTFTYLPGFYVEGSPAVLDWSQATQLTLNDNDQLTGIKVILKSVADSGSIGIVSGSGLIKSETGSGETGVSGAVVTLKGSNGQVINYTTSNNDGSFIMKNLPGGTYGLTVNKVGFDQFNKSITIADNASTHDFGSILLTQSVLGVNDNTIANPGFSAYPNPASDNVNLNFEASAGRMTISIVNTVGLQVMSKVVETISGSNNTALDVRGLAGGMYFVKLSDGLTTNAYPLIIQR